jgi:hypothetical protein
VSGSLLRNQPSRRRFRQRCKALRISDFTGLSPLVFPGGRRLVTCLLMLLEQAAPADQVVKPLMGDYRDRIPIVLCQDGGIGAVGV